MCKILVLQEKQKIVVAPIGSAVIFSFSVESRACAGFVFLTLIALTSVNGTWLGECQVDGVISTRVEQVLRDGAFILTVTTFSDTLCNQISMQPSIEGTYKLGSAVSVDGSVDGITTATQVNSVFDNNVLPADFDLVAIKGDKLYLGLNGADGSATDGTSAAKRPTRLDAAKVFTRQP